MADGVQLSRSATTLPHSSRRADDRTGTVTYVRELDGLTKAKAVPG